VGHADITLRLLEVDPRWSWRPMFHDVPPDLMAAAVATGNPEIVNSVIGNSPPQLDAWGGMWMILTVHDDDGHEVERIGYGDAEGGRGTDQMKIIIGDGIRNAAMRFGAATELWSKAEKDEGGRPEQEDSPGSPDGKDKPLKQGETGKPTRSTTRASGGSGRRKRGENEASPDEPLTGENRDDWEKRRELVRKATDLSTSSTPGLALDTLKLEVYEPAKAEGWLRSLVYSPFTEKTAQLTEVISEAKSRLEARISEADQVAEPA
jgi:hypothetical protein